LAGVQTGELVRRPKERISVGTVIVVILVVAIIAAAVVFLQPRIRERGRLGGLAARAGRRPAAERGADDVPRGREERKLVAEGEAIRDRVEADLAEMPPAVRARHLASRGSGEVERPVEEPHRAPSRGAAEEAYADDPEAARRAEERRLREIARASRGGTGGRRPPRVPPADGEGRR
jgi:hypothetical protein